VSKYYELEEQLATLTREKDQADSKLKKKKIMLKKYYT